MKWGEDMAIYQYKCEFCDFEFEQTKPMSKSDESEGCPKCMNKCYKVVSGGCGFILKGEGWPGKEIKLDNIKK